MIRRTTSCLIATFLTTITKWESTRARRIRERNNPGGRNVTYREAFYRSTAKILKGKRVVASRIIVGEIRSYAKPTSLHLPLCYPRRIIVASFYDKGKCRFNYHMIYGGYIRNLGYLVENRFHHGITSKHTACVIEYALSFYKIIQLF